MQAITITLLCIVFVSNIATVLFALYVFRRQQQAETSRRRIWHAVATHQQKSQWTAAGLLQQCEQDFKNPSIWWNSF